ncbi:hypothetical protein GC088_09960 [Arthrobacter sp. JZ12]|uniref:hypothetical protein n=1 Tax=Arthrobacter sp. JZ12 TaxID=2654190 RepID=UPI002B492D77|nr:hypothetical protein [Arthrobacter sp. JZ12]WRH25353.1 hypothetical protein GC088_09960 [Arthrobacter sp. JZ12]
MQAHSKLFMIGGAIFIVGFLLLASGISAYAAAHSDGAEPQLWSGLLLAVGGVLTLSSAGILIRSLLLQRRASETVQTWDSRDDPDVTRSRPAAFGDRPKWMDRPVNHMGDNYGHKRD